MYIDDKIRDEGLVYLTNNGDEVYLCSQAPANFTEATATHALTDPEPIGFGSPADYTGGRQVSSTTVSGGDVSTSGTATHVAVVDSVNQILLVVIALGSGVSVLAGGTYDLNSFNVRMPD